MEQPISFSQTLQGFPVVQRQALEIYPFISSYVEMKQRMIDDIESVVKRYENKRIKEESAYQTMSPLRRIFAGKKPDHHVAVEYIHYVRKPMEQVRRLKAEIEAAVMIQTQTSSSDWVIVPDDFESFMTK